MLWFYRLFFPVLWIAFYLYWRIAALNVKTTRRLESLSSRATRTVLFLLGVALLCLPMHVSIPWLAHSWLFLSWIHSGYGTFYGGAAITVAGLLFAIWARLHIGRNWSSAVTIKQNHELITTGPYRLVRHPIYTGLLLALLGSAIALTQIRGLVAFPLFFFSLWYKLRLEEKWMRSQFGDAYLVYSRHTAALVPFLL